MQFLTALFAAASLFVAARATPAPLSSSGVHQLDVWSPNITFPTEGSVLAAKSMVNVTWETNNAPPVISNGAMLLLGKGNEDYPFILAKGFDLRSGYVEVEVPYVISGDSYNFVVFGDSGNASPSFTITSDVL
uniref:Ser-Thr-rich glycosyl-phosphatidyl-inositol-anchored membrane family-domain-containing protein n=1 Tax=Mycena chlorophos TaxID=658473 RepID=A0ABQ0KZY1_MYCCL|nr:predicted protein [Mycena chlorophos]